ncbi:uncharacterized protein LOC127707789 [Mytilus californianus]|uniref:uncharacterized protein LOC127707789 n=1 Tax=Mytilus californianus TaxID=6549 RepID=UPI0022466B89|nr:uncharacterized protein LOC127707789 [Mytilus californianus]
MAYCKRKMRNIYCDGIDNSIIFRIRNKYLQWTCSKEQDVSGKKYFRGISRTINENTTTTFAIRNSITYTATTTPVHSKVTRADNYAMIICNCVLFMLVLLVWVVLYLRHHRQRKQVSKRNKRTSSTRQEQTSSTRQVQTSSTSQSPRISNYEQISEVTISRPFHITNETYSDACVF